MKMHQRAMFRQQDHVQFVDYTVMCFSARPDNPVHVHFVFDDDKTKRLIMSAAEARELAKKLNKHADLADEG